MTAREPLSGAVRVVNETRGTVLADAGRVANTLVARTVGLLNRRSLDPGEGLLIVPCSSIHMFFMRFAIDAVYVNRAGEVVGVDEHLAPWRIGRFYKRVRWVLELPAGTAARCGTRPGDRLRVEGYAL